MRPKTVAVLVVLVVLGFTGCGSSSSPVSYDDCLDQAKTSQQVDACREAQEPEPDVYADPYAEQSP